jgi:hypothetical protein
MASIKLEEKLEEQVYLTDKYVCVKLMIKLHLFSHRRKIRALIIAKKKREMPQTPMSLICQNQWKEIKIKVCGQNVNMYMEKASHNTRNQTTQKNPQP